MQREKATIQQSCVTPIHSFRLKVSTMITHVPDAEDTSESVTDSHLLRVPRLVAERDLNK